MRFQRARLLGQYFFGAVAAVSIVATLAAARPSALELLPEETLLLVRTPNAGEMFERFRDTQTGRMVRDPQVAPFVERLYGSAGDLYAEKVAEWLATYSTEKSFL